LEEELTATAAVGVSVALPEDCSARAMAEASTGLEAEPTEAVAALAECLGWEMEVEARDWGVREDWPRSHRDRCMWSPHPRSPGSLDD